jgi:peptidoglycan/LPS O-acetylase OafA/YrhL
MNIHRRYDIDWVRVIAIGLLLVYHTAIGFQPWGMMIGFITAPHSWVSLWTPMSMLNIWRIPLLFFVSGMGVCLAMQNRNWKQLLLERGQRILMPFAFGIFCIVPIHIFILQSYYSMDIVYKADPAHVWFLGNICIYILLLTPLFFFIRQNEHYSLVQGFKRLMGTPLGLLVVIAAMVAEVLILNPRPYEYYAMTKHGFYMGLLAFFFGFCFVWAGDTFWKMIVRGRWWLLAGSVLLFALRTFVYPLNTPYYLLPVESCLWIVSVLAMANRYLNKPGKALRYLSKAAYPVYILHMIFLYLGSMLFFRLNIPTLLQYVGTLMFTLTGCFVAYEVVKRTSFIRFLLGIKAK